jgi:DNA primase
MLRAAPLNVTVDGRVVRVTNPDRALVSAPLTWDDLRDADTADFDIRTMPDRFAVVGDLMT